ncbi:MAG: glycine/betaine ABC transporter substrate-binding protein [Actinomycetota bacterium]|nr:glycine/betaine ABC transporter substrate-binding protein [Actinomycetota bacterium]
MRHHRSILLTLLATLLAALVVAGCGGDDEEGGGSAQQPAEGGGEEQSRVIQPIQGAEQTSITVGSKNFEEQYILGEIYAQSLEAAGFDVTKELDIGSEVVAYEALTGGQIDAYPEYTGTALTSFFDVELDTVPRDAQQAYQQAREAYAEDGITALPPTPFENSYRIGMLNETAQRLGNPTKISDLQGEAGELSISGFPECRQRTDCLLGVQQEYGLDFADFVASESPYEVLDTKEAELAFVFTTDGNLATGQYAVLDDDRNLFPPYNVTLSVRDEIAQAMGPEGAQVIERVQEQLTEDVMQELNSRVAVDKQEPERVAADYLQQFGFVEG